MARFPLQQADQPLLGVLKGDAGLGHVVQPGLERRWHGEVVHRRADDHDIGGLQLCQGLTGFLRGIGQVRGAQVRQRLGSEFADDGVSVRMLAQQSGLNS